MTTQLEELDGKYSSAEKGSKGLRDQVEELTEQLAEETRAKIAASNKLKQLQDEVEKLNGQVEDEEEAKESLQAKLVTMTSQVSLLQGNSNPDIYNMYVYTITLYLIVPLSDCFRVTLTLMYMCQALGERGTSRT